jgi:hypothetical protein
VTTMAAVGVLVTAAGCGLSFVWWMFSGAAAWIEPDDRDPPGGTDDREDDDD